MKRLWMLVWAFFVVAALVATPVVAIAHDTRPLDQAAVPEGIGPREDSGNELVFTGRGLTLHFINRGIIEVRVSNGSARAWPGTTSSSTINDVVGGYLIRASYDKHEYILQNTTDGYGWDGYTRYTTIRGTDPGETDEGDLGRRWAALSDDDIRAIFDGAWMHIISTYERIPNSVEDGCDVSVHDVASVFPGLGIINATDDNPAAPVAWACATDKIFGVDTVLRDLENFNVTHVANADATLLQIVYIEDNQEADSFIYCDNGTYALGSGDDSCSNGGRDGWHINAEPSVFQVDGNVAVTVTDGERSYELVVAGSQSTVQNQDSPAAAAADGGDSCEANSGVLGWILCPIAQLLDGVLGYLDNQIEIKLRVREEYYKNDGLYEAWTVVRNIAYAILVPIMLVMVIGTALGFEIFSAYTIKKALPRMVIAVIFITLSWYICTFLVEFFNIVGSGIRGLVTNPFEISQEGGALQNALANAELHESGHSSIWGTLRDGTNVVGVGVVAAAGSIAFLYLATAMLMSMLGTAVLILGIALIILLARQMFIVAAILLAPLAILAWIFPGNDKMWKLWWNMFSKLLMIFPLIMLLIALGQIFGKLAGEVGEDNDNLIRAITVIGAVIIPYAAIPFTFKWAGGVFGNLAGMMNDREKGVLDRLKKGRAEKRSQAWGNFKAGTGTGFGQKNALTRGLGSRIGAGAGGGKGFFGYGEKGRARMDQMNRENAVGQVMKNPAWNGVNQDDHALHAGILLQDMDKKAAIAALTDPNGEHRLEAAEAERAVAAWQASGLGGRAAAIAAAQQLVSTGTGYRNLQHMTRTLARAAGGNTSTATALAGFANSETKRAGRHDLAPGFGTADRLTRSWMDGRGGLSDLSTVSQADWDGAHGSAWRSGSLYEHANDKPANLENHIGHFQRQLQESLANGDEAGRDEALVFFEELRAMKPNAKGENSAIINRTLNGSGDAGNPSAGDLVEQAYASMATTSQTTEEVDTGIVDPSTGQTIRRTQTNTTSDGGAAARQRILGQSRSYERPDQNRLADPGAPTPQPGP